MKNHVPIKRHQALVSFSKDHHFGLLLVWKIRQGLANAIRPERISSYVLFFFKEDLEQHFREEEQLLFCKLPLLDLLRKRAEAEHTDLCHLIDAIRQNITDAALLHQFADMLESHIRFEERKLFGYLQTKIPAGELERITFHSSGNRIDIDTRWPDRFWEKSKIKVEEQ